MPITSQHAFTERLSHAGRMQQVGQYTLALWNLTLAVWVKHAVVSMRPKLWALLTYAANTEFQLNFFPSFCDEMTQDRIHKCTRHMYAFIPIEVQQSLLAMKFNTKLVHFPREKAKRKTSICPHIIIIIHRLSCDEYDFQIPLNIVPISISNRNGNVNQNYDFRCRLLNFKKKKNAWTLNFFFFY